MSRMLAFANDKIAEFKSNNRNAEMIVFIGGKRGWYFKYRLTGIKTQWSNLTPWEEPMVKAEIDLENGWSYVDFKSEENKNEGEQS